MRTKYLIKYVLQMSQSTRESFHLTSVVILSQSSPLPLSADVPTEAADATASPRPPTAATAVRNGSCPATTTTATTNG